MAFQTSRRPAGMVPSEFAKRGQDGGQRLGGKAAKMLAIVGEIGFGDPVPRRSRDPQARRLAALQQMLLNLLRFELQALYLSAKGFAHRNRNFPDSGFE